MPPYVNTEQERQLFSFSVANTNESIRLSAPLLSAGVCVCVQECENPRVFAGKLPIFKSHNTIKQHLWALNWGQSQLAFVVVMEYKPGTAVFRKAR